MNLKNQFNICNFCNRNLNERWFDIRKVQSMNLNSNQQIIRRFYSWILFNYNQPLVRNFRKITGDRMIAHRSNSRCDFRSIDRPRRLRCLFSVLPRTLPSMPCIQRLHAHARTHARTHTLANAKVTLTSRVRTWTHCENRVGVARYKLLRLGLFPLLLHILLLFPSRSPL